MDETGQAQYEMLWALYAAFRAGRMTARQGERVKEQIAHYDALGTADKAMLLEYFIPQLEANVPALKLLSRVYYRETGGKRPYVKNTILEE